MTEEVQNLAEVDSAPATEVTATPETVENAPVVADEQKEPSRVFTQEELDAAIGKRLAREQRKWEREQTQRQAETQALRAPADIPPVDQFESPEAYADALAYKKAEELLAQREHARQQTEILETYHEKEEEARNKYDDFEQVAYNPKLPITTVMAQSIQASDVGPEVAYYLGANPKEADRISRLAPILQAKEIADGKDYTGYNSALLARTMGTKFSEKRDMEWGGFGSFHEKVTLPSGLISGSGSQLWTSAAFMNVCLRAKLVDLK